LLPNPSQHARLGMIATTNGRRPATPQRQGNRFFVRANERHRNVARRLGAEGVGSDHAFGVHGSAIRVPPRRPSNHLRGNPRDSVRPKPYFPRERRVSVDGGAAALRECEDGGEPPVVCCSGWHLRSFHGGGPASRSGSGRQFSGTELATTRRKPSILAMFREAQNTQRPVHLGPSNRLRQRNRTLAASRKANFLQPIDPARNRAYAYRWLMHSDSRRTCPRPSERPQAISRDLQNYSALIRKFASEFGARRG